MTGHAFPDSYPAGAGPDRTPNTFGGFTLRLGAGATAPVPSAPGGSGGGEAATPSGPGTATGTTSPAAGGTGTSSAAATRRAVTLAKAPFAGPGLRLVELRSARSKKVVATGKVRGRLLTLTSVKRGHKLAALQGRYLLRVRGAKKLRQTSVVLP